MSTEIVRNAPVRDEYKTVLKALKPVMYDLPPKIISIDGRPGVGKTTLGRFLAWRFNVSLIETDLFLHRQLGTFKYRADHVDEIIEHRISGDRPVIVEGVVTLELLSELDRQSDFHINVSCEDAVGNSLMDVEWTSYEKKFQPQLKADLCIEVPASVN